MKPDKIKDANKKSPSHPDYNPRTLYVPEDFKQKLTPVKYLFIIETYFINNFIIFYLGCSTMVGVKITIFWLHIIFQSWKILWNVSYGCCYYCQRIKSFVYEGIIFQL